MSTYSGMPTNSLILAPLFDTIPPERVGLNGEYDHFGLAKRVALAFSKYFQVDELKNLQTTQRGRVVILKGTVPSREVLRKLVNIAKTINGATDVETLEVSVGEEFGIPSLTTIC